MIIMINTMKMVMKKVNHQALDLLKEDLLFMHVVLENILFMKFRLIFKIVSLTRLRSFLIKEVVFMKLKKL